MIALITGSPCSGKTCKAIELALAQEKPVYTNIIDNTSDKSFLPKSFKKIPNDDWTLIEESAFIIYDSCESFQAFTSLNKHGDPFLQSLFYHKHFGEKQLNHSIIFIFQHEKFANKTIRMLAELIHMNQLFNHSNSILFQE